MVRLQNSFIMSESILGILGSIENLLPQAHVDGISDDVQPYLRARASWAPL